MAGPGNFFDQFDNRPAPAPSAPPAFIPGSASPLKQAADARDQRRLQLAEEEARRQQNKDSMEIQDKRTKAANARSEAIANLRRFLDQIDDADKNVRNSGIWGSVGRSGTITRDWPSSFYPGSDAANLDALLDPINANNAFTALQTMRANSPTGAALGAVSDTELGLLKANVSSLKTTQDSSSFIKSLNTQRKNAVRILSQLDPQASAAYLQEFGRRYPGGTNAKPRPAPRSNPADDALIEKYLKGGR